MAPIVDDSAFMEFVYDARAWSINFQKDREKNKEDEMMKRNREIVTKVYPHISNRCHSIGTETVSDDRGGRSSLGKIMEKIEDAGI